MRPVSYINQRRTISTASVPRHARTASASRHPSAWPVGPRSRAAKDAAAADARLELEQEIATVQGLMARSGNARPPLLGAPTRCPDCNEWGFVQATQPGGHLHACRACGAEWLITARALLAVQAELDARARVADPAPVVAPSIALHPLTVWTPPAEPADAATATAAAAPADSNRRAAAAADRVIDLAAARRFRAYGAGQPAVLGG